MKDPKVSRLKSWGFGVHSSRGVSSKQPCKVIGVSFFALVMVVFLWGPGSIENVSPRGSNELAKTHAHEKSVALKSVSSNPTASAVYKKNAKFSFSPKVVNFDEQRKSWWKANPDVRAGRPKVLIVTGSQPAPCNNPLDTHMYLKSAKNKVHYSRMHDLQMYYNLVEPHKDLGGSWTKLAVLRMQMLAHPEVEWLWWMDSDLVITDMEFQIPLDRYKGFNLVLYGDEHRVLELNDWKSLSTGNFLIRNCQWSLHLLDAWAAMGDVHHRDVVGNSLSDSLLDRPQGMEADDQSALVYLLSTEKNVWAPKTYLENVIFFTGDWVTVTDKLEEIENYDHGDPRWPVTTHFAGCSRCGGREGAWPWDECQRGMERAMDFADSQAYRRYGFELRGLDTPELVPVPGFNMQTIVEAPEMPLGDFKGFPIHKLPGPRVENWDAQREAWFKKNPDVKRLNDHGLPKTMIVTGSSPSECTHPVGGHGLLQALKNKIDYARFHDMSIFYGQVDFDKQLEYWWTKIPTIHILMLAHPDVEWFWWCDGDAAITDMVFTPPYQTFDAEGQNLVLYGDYDLLKKNDWIALNAGIFLVRNCQWTLDLFDIWSAQGIKAARAESGRRSSEVLVGRDPTTPGEDQSALLYIMVTEKDEKEQKWTPGIRLEKGFTMSGYWKNFGPRLETLSKAHKGSGGEKWPWITHFAGCQPCGDKMGNFDVAECRLQLRRAFDFAENQVLEQYGLVHSSLGNPEVRRLKAYEKMR